MVAPPSQPEKRLPSAAWLAVLLASTAVLIYGTFVVLNLVGLR